jgi:hypothetical protein
MLYARSAFIILIIGFCILLRVILTVNNTFFFARIDKAFYYVKTGKNIQYFGSTGIVGIKKQASVMCIQNLIRVIYIYMQSITIR